MKPHFFFPRAHSLWALYIHGPNVQSCSIRTIGPQTKGRERESEVLKHEGHWRCLMGLGVFLALVGFNQCDLGSGGESKPMPRCDTTRDGRVHGHRNGPAALRRVLLPHPGHPRRVRVPISHARRWLWWSTSIGPRSSSRAAGGRYSPI